MVLAATALAELHPVRDEIVDEVNLNAGSWRAKPVQDNHLRLRSPASIKNSMGHLGSSPSLVPSDFLKTMATGAQDFFKQVAKTFSSSAAGKEEHLRLRQSDVIPEDDDLPAQFSWRDKKPECLGEIQDQGECGSCWAFTSAGLLSDRFCVSYL